MPLRRRPSAVSSFRLSAQCQELEARRMLYSFSLSGGILRLYGDDVADTILVTKEGNRIRAQLIQDGVTITNQTYSYKSTNSIFISGNGGDDYISVDNAIKQPCSIGGGNGNDTLIGGGGNDYIGGSPGDDVMQGQGGADTMIGGGGFDTADYSMRTGDLRITLDGIANDGEANERDLVSQDVQRILGGSGNDYIAGRNDSKNGADYIWGGDGNDTLLGLDGDDTLVGSRGNDLLDGGGGRDLLYGETGKDTLYGGAGNDTLKGGKGIDKLYGGAGRDKLYDRDGYIDLLDGGKDEDSVLDKDDNDVLVSIP